MSTTAYMSSGNVHIIQVASRTWARNSLFYDKYVTSSILVLYAEHIVISFENSNILFNKEIITSCY